MGKLIDWYVMTIFYCNKWLGRESTEQYKDFMDVKSTYEQEFRDLNQTLMSKIRNAEQRRNGKK